MSDSKTYRPESGQNSAEEGIAARGKGDGWEAYSNWLNRIQKTGGRHAAITRNLYSWSNYKSWADKVRDTWGDEK